MDKLNISFPIIVEGKYDKIKLKNIVNASIIKLDGFQVFKNEEKKQVLLALAKKSPIIVLTDSDGGGKVLRSYLSSILPKEKIIPLYIPQVEGKEKRKETPSAEGFLGVEGVDEKILYNLLKPFESINSVFNEKNITKTDLFEAHLTGFNNSQALRDEIANKLDLPKNLSTNAFLDALNILLTYDEFIKIAKKEP